MSVSDFIIWACGDHQLIGPVVSDAILFPSFVPEIRETAFQAADYVGIMALPRAVCRQWNQSWQIVTFGQLFNDQIHERRGRFADRKARMRAAFDEDHRQPEAPRDHCQQRRAEARADDCHIEIASHLISAQNRQAIGSGIFCVRFISASRAARELEQLQS